VSLVSLMARDR